MSRLFTPPSFKMFVIFCLWTEEERKNKVLKRFHILILERKFCDQSSKWNDFLHFYSEQKQQRTKKIEGKGTDSKIEMWNWGTGVTKKQACCFILIEPLSI